ncbi:MAG: hypothetical protein JWQ34_3552 [Mucilaginibacter sp.]|uniref:tectonin domain-containing protein n=1 Tax=Mucilaginibacter sp. TaxID=1882438 RepID=UPI00261C528D|nr:tectonin domain-containing protein [Mucilaginibacter sp.]MDB5005327.1 hypothetical protein [Mucilaginibacter sp.]
MKKNLTTLLTGILLILFADSCRKGQTPLETQTNQTKNQVSKMPGFGAILDRKAYLNAPKADFNQIKSLLSKNGFAKDLKLDATLPSSVYLNYPVVMNQGTSNTCVSFATDAMIETLNNEFPGINVSNPRSPWFIYQMDHSFYGGCGNPGMHTYNGINIAKIKGIPSYTLDPDPGDTGDNSDDFCHLPATSVINDAATNKIGNFYSLSTISDIKIALSYHLPVVMGFKAFSSFLTAFYNGTTYSAVGTDDLGTGHEVCIVGYDDAKQAFLVQNSYGTTYNNNPAGDPDRPGMMWFGYNLFSEPSLQIELYVGTPNIPVLTVSDLAFAGNTLYAIGATNVGNGGNAIYQWGNNAWARLNGAGIAITGTPSGTPWVVNNEGKLFQYVSNIWQLVSMGLTDVSIGANGAMYGIGDTSTDIGGYGIYGYASNGTWTKIQGAAVKIKVDPTGRPWVINAQNYVFKYNGTVFQSLPGRITDLAIGANGSVFAIGNNTINTDGYGIYKWSGSDWILIYGAAVHIAVDKTGNPWVVNSVGHLYSGTAGGVNNPYNYIWTQLN